MYIRMYIIIIIIIKIKMNTCSRAQLLTRSESESESESDLAQLNTYRPSGTRCFLPLDEAQPWHTYIGTLTWLGLVH